MSRTNVKHERRGDPACVVVPPARPASTLAQEARAGLLRAPRQLPPKYFYDAYGSALFDRICDQPEYYPTRTESRLLERHARDIVAMVRPRSVIEFGSGMPRKIRYLLDACEATGCAPGYCPFDVCHEVLVNAGRMLTDDYPWLEVLALVGDYGAGLAHLPPVRSPALYIFLGSTIGNFAHADAVAFLREVRGTMCAGDHLLLGADRVKDPQVLHAAYNDAEGLTAEFNVNLLRVLNRELGADFDIEGFRHYACYNAPACQVEMYLIAATAQDVDLTALGQRVHFEEGAHILTEISRKFTRATLEALLAEAGFTVVRHLQDDCAWFSLVLARVH
ncbi:MAG: L-histidine N(alpha)-methyltransferase [Gammaproteobacteria bacterium]|nr:L-histidine N(alpha)-methyltransferase [Gammaproteobacteria bacterium]